MNIFYIIRNNSEKSVNKSKSIIYMYLIWTSVQYYPNWIFSSKELYQLFLPYAKTLSVGIYTKKKNY